MFRVQRWDVKAKAEASRFLRADAESIFPDVKEQFSAIAETLAGGRGNIAQAEPNIAFYEAL